MPTIDNDEASKKLEETILMSEPICLGKYRPYQKVIIESEASPETFKQIIVASGHKID